MGTVAQLAYLIRTAYWTGQFHAAVLTGEARP
jgi:hypothetical protein